ncbi:MAG TPA: four helix bundle protein [Anaerolineae bacterium]|nr:four helix bundle protein [Anaerolineae bacterium]HID85122.1 four helix bundle protein [Anaerolineales bacterium]HIQ08247.1 four helix bundle protein [Anaerolineaceae bacterium]
MDCPEKAPSPRDHGLKEQIQRAAVSVMANIAEGFDCDSNAEFARFLGYARRSAPEVQALLHAARLVGHITQEEFDIVYALAGKAKGLIGGLRASLRRQLHTSHMAHET